MDDVWIDAVEQFLKGDDWRNRVLSFVDNNCALYANDTGDISAFTHGQYDIWHEFKDLVDSCIGSVLSDLGGSEESFARACEDRLKERDKGPRDAAVKEVLRKLLTYDSFEDFGYMMKVRWQELEGNERTDVDYFAEMEAAGGTTKVDLPSRRETKYEPDDEAGAGQKTDAGEYEGDEIEALQRRLKLKEWEIQIEISKSILGKGDGNEAPELMDWAKGVLEMEQLLLPGSGASASQIGAHKKTLTILRNKVDLVVAKKMLEDNEKLRKDLKRKFEFKRDAAAEGGVTDTLQVGEKNLDSLIERHAETQADVHTQRQCCVEYFQDRRVSQEAYSEVYFFLKEIIRQKNSFMLEQDEVHDFIFNRIGHEEMSLVPALLKLIVLEDEETWLQAHIRAIVSGEPVDREQFCRDGEGKASENSAAMEALERAEVQARRAEEERETAEAKLSETREESNRVQTELAEKAAAAGRIAAENMEKEMHARVEAEVQARMTQWQHEKEEEMRKLEEKRERIAEDSVRLQKRLEQLDAQRQAAEKKEAELKALKAKAHEVTRAAIQKNKELKELDEDVQMRLNKEVEAAELRKARLKEEEQQMNKLRQEREAEERRLTAEQEKRKTLESELQQEIEAQKKMKHEKNEEESSRIQKAFELKARDHVENQRKEVAAMKEKLQERLKKKREKKKRRSQRGGEMKEGPDVDDAEMRATLSKARVKQLAIELNNKLGTESPEPKVAQNDEGPRAGEGKPSPTAQPAPAQGKLPPLYSRGKMEERDAPSAGSEDSQFAHFGGHARPHSGPMDTFKVTTKESPLRPGTATKFKYDSHEEELARITSEAEKERHKLTLAMQMEHARQRQATKARRERRRTRRRKGPVVASPMGAVAGAKVSEGKTADAPKRSRTLEDKKNYKASGDHRTKNLLDEAQKLRDRLAASLRRGRKKPKARSSGKAMPPPAPPSGVVANKSTVEPGAVSNVNLSSLRYLQGKYSPAKVAWVEGNGREMGSGEALTEEEWDDTINF